MAVKLSNYPTPDCPMVCLGQESSTLLAGRSNQIRHFGQARLNQTLVPNQTGLSAGPSETASSRCYLSYPIDIGRPIGIKLPDCVTRPNRVDCPIGFKCLMEASARLVKSPMARFTGLARLPDSPLPD